jgi:hypothetical protein
MVHMDYISERRREMQTTLRVLQAYSESKIDLISSGNFHLRLNHTNTAQTTRHPVSDGSHCITRTV